jgi:hypothetical protein
MDHVNNLSEIVSQVVAEYEADSPMATLHYIHDTDKRIDLVLVIPHDRSIDPHVVVMTRLDGERVLVEIDTTDRPLDEALVAAGIPRTQIALTWRGETLPTA